MSKNNRKKTKKKHPLRSKNGAIHASLDLTNATESYTAQPDVLSSNIELALSCSSLQHIKN